MCDLDDIPEAPAPSPGAGVESAGVLDAHPRAVFVDTEVDEEVRRNGTPAGEAQGLSRRTFLRGAALVAGATAVSNALPAWLTPRAAAVGTRQFYRMDPHVHCVVSADAVDDVGILSTAASSGPNPYDVIFISDHHPASRFTVANQGALSGTWKGDIAGGNGEMLDVPTASRWTAGHFGSNVFISGLATTPALGATKSLQLSSQSSQYAESFAFYKRGPNMFCTGITLDFWVYPVRVDPNCAIFVSAAIGGDATIANLEADGYTLKSSYLSRPGTTKLLIWQVGGSTDVPLAVPAAPGGTTVYRGPRQADFTLNQWNHYKIVVDPVLATALVTNTPLDSNALVYLKMAVASNGGGTVQCYFDGWRHSGSLALNSSQEFANRNVDIANLPAAATTVMPAIELGNHDHVQRLNFADASQWKDYAFGDGTDGGPNGIADTQASGYPATLNHPGLPGGSPMQSTIDTNAFNADIMEACPRGASDVMITIWDAILSKGVPLVGCWSSDAHRVATLGPCTYLEAPAKDLDSLSAAYFEGRAFMAGRTFGGSISFGPTGATSSRCYPSRYPLLVSPSASVPVSLTFSGGVGTTTLKWIVNAAVASTQTIATSGATNGFRVPVGIGASTYVRAELLNGATRYAMTEALLFTPIAGLPIGTTLGVTGVVTADGRGYTKTLIKGILNATYDATSATLALMLANPVASIVTMTGDAPDAVSTVLVDNQPIAVSPSQAAFDAATTSCWFQQGGSLAVKVLHSLSSHAVKVVFVGGASGDHTPPSVPSGVAASQLVSGAVRATWTASTDNIRVVGYTVYRDGAALDTVDASTLSYDDSTVTPSTAYAYTVDAFDGAGNHSARSSAATVTTGGPPITQTLGATVDAYVSSATPGSNFGSATTLKVDADGALQSYLRFRLPSTAGRLISATLTIFPMSSQSVGYDVYGVANDGWTETGLTWTNRPPMAAAKVGSSGKVTSGTPTSVDVSALITTDLFTNGGDLNLGLQTTSNTALSVASRQAAANPPQLVLISTSPGTNLPAAPSGVSAAQTPQGPVAVSWNPSTPGSSSITGYTVFRNGAALTTVAGTLTTYSDPTVAAATTYQYQVQAFDAAGNNSASSTAASIATGSTATTLTATCEADCYVDLAKPSTNFGKSVMLRVDADGQKSYLRFTVPATGGTVVGAVLKVFANSAQTVGYDVYAVADNGWTETLLTWAAAPAAAGTKTGSSGRVIANTVTSVDVSALVNSALVNGGGKVSLMLATTSTTALSLSSREGANPPQLLITLT